MLSPIRSVRRRWAPATSARSWAFALFAGLALIASQAAFAQAATPYAAPASVAAAPQPKPDDTNAQRAKSQPGNNAPFWRSVRGSGDHAGVTNLPGAEKGVLIQSFVQYPGSRLTNAGEAWRQVRNDWIIPYGGSLLLIMLVAMVLFYLGRGPIGHSRNVGQRRIERFSVFERAAHWVNATAFVLLALSGITVAFGKFFLLPLVGHAAFGWIAYAMKNLHNFCGPLFAVSLLIVFITFLRDNVPRREDLAWFKNGGGAWGRGGEAPSHRFNAGEKVVFWGGVLLLGAITVVTGFIMNGLIPTLGDTRGQMQVAHMVHSVAATLLLTVFIFHIYVGTVGVRGAYRAMREGYVDDDWAREHHALWHADIEAGKIPAKRSSHRPPAGKPAAQS